MLVLPGNTASSVHHQDELGHFGRHFWAVSPDFWGTGASERLEVWPEDWYEQCAHDMAALVEHAVSALPQRLLPFGGRGRRRLAATIEPRAVHGAHLRKGALVHIGALQMVAGAARVAVEVVGIV